jgi:hypothetical protein
MKSLDKGCLQINQKLKLMSQWTKLKKQHKKESLEKGCLNIN